MTAAPKDGNVSALELYLLASLCQSTRPRAIFEFGTFDGRTTLNLAANTDPSTTMYTLDLPKSELHDTKLHLATGDKTFIDKDCSGSRFLGTPYAQKIVQLYGDSATFDFSPYRGTADLVFVDASHSYKYVLSDSHNALKLLGPSGGTILWHDYGEWDGVTLALNELLETDASFRNVGFIESTSLAYLHVPPSPDTPDDPNKVG